MKKLFILLCCALAFAQCENDEAALELLNSPIGKNIVSTRTGLSKSDVVYLIQSDKLSMLLDAIRQNESGYYLSLTLDEAQTIGIPDSLYQRATEIVKSYNQLK